MRLDTFDEMGRALWAGAHHQALTLFDLIITLSPYFMIIYLGGGVCAPSPEHCVCVYVHPLHIPRAMSFHTLARHGTSPGPVLSLSKGIKSKKIFLISRHSLNERRRKEEGREGGANE